MATQKIGFGDSVTGLLIDGDADTPFVAATMHLDAELGIRLEVPYIDHPGDAQFQKTGEWFSERQPPANLILTAVDGDVSLFGCEYSGHTANYPRGIGLGRISPSEVVLKSRDGNLQDPLKVSVLRSRIDGLNEWTRFTAIREAIKSDHKNIVRSVTFELSESAEFSWCQGMAKMTLGSKGTVEPSGRSRLLDDNVWLTSKFADAQPVDTHLREHEKFVSLLAFIFGCEIHFREHEIRDTRFLGRMMNGRIAEAPFCRLFSARTVKQHARKPPNRLRSALTGFDVIGRKGLEEWSKKFDERGRFIHPAVSSINRPGAILENLVVNAAMSMEAAGNMIGLVPGESVTYGGNGKPITSTYIYRCLVSSGWNWTSICLSLSGLAKAIANNYNTIKHYDRGAFPDPRETYLIGLVAILIVRMLAIRFARNDLSTGRLFGDRVDDFQRIEREFDQENRVVDEEGVFVPRP